MSHYTIDQGAGVRERMNLLAAVHSPATSALLDTIGVPTGARCVDLGCGGGHVAMELVHRVGPSGSVLGIDLDEELIALARADAAERSVANVEFRAGAAEDLAEHDFDVAYSRLLLCHLRAPEAVVALMTRAVRPGGVVIVEDADFSACFCDPPNDAYDRWARWYMESMRRRGGDPELGRRLPSLLRDAGLHDVQARVAQPVNLRGPHKYLQVLSMEKSRTAALADQVATAPDYDATIAALRAFTDDQSTLLASPRIVQAWARRSATQRHVPPS